MRISLHVVAMIATLDLLSRHFGIMEYADRKIYFKFIELQWFASLNIAHA